MTTTMLHTATSAPAAIVRRATEADVPRILEMGLAFAAEEYARFLLSNPSQIEALIRHLLVGETTALFVVEREERVLGMIAVQFYVHPMSLERIATEIAWWMDPAARGTRDGLRLLQAAEGWARDQQAVRMQMIAPNEHVGRFYERLGFAQVEIHYQRTL
jgi:RimJ/RimL family protein N-acetyltransferase